MTSSPMDIDESTLQRTGQTFQPAAIDGSFVGWSGLQPPWLTSTSGQNAAPIKPRLVKDEVEILEAEFQKNPKPTSAKKRELAESFGVDVPLINNWFQNRRAKERQMKKAAELELQQEMKESAEFKMHQDSSLSESSDPEGSGASSNSKDKEGGATSDISSTRVRRVRKRTKSGCLTCRKRRVKCDENRPICDNCRKLKRQCEGYNPFKEPQSGFPAWPFSIIAPGLPSYNFVPPRPRPRPPPLFSDAPKSSDAQPEPARAITASGDEMLDAGQAEPIIFEIFGKDDYYKDDEEGNDDDDEDDEFEEGPPQTAQLGEFLKEGLTNPPRTRQKAPELALTTYVPSPADSPLTNPQTAAIFWHFIHVTAPTISLYEGNGMYNGRFSLAKPVPVAVPYAAPEISVWTESFPVMSFQHPALLQAILALASLHLAKLQRSSTTAAMKHYHLALRRAARNLKSPSKRNHPATAAALLLLAHFEMWMSDYEKWRSHLLGLSMVFNEQHDTAGAGLVTGTQALVVDYGKATLRANKPESKPSIGPPSPETYEQLREVYWSLAKMDVYQSMIGSTSLFLGEDARKKYPPRAPMGDMTTIHGTHDHLTVLLRRLADFAANERRRKGETDSRPIYDITSVSALQVENNTVRFNDLAGSELSLAWAEWERIRGEFETFKDKLGPSFQPLEDIVSPRESPFGPTMEFRTYPIAGVWMNYYMGLIYLYRLKPDLPTQAWLAAGMVARRTATFAEHIGQIAAGLNPDLPATGNVNSTQGATLIESCFPLLMAGIQCINGSRRNWIVQYLINVESVTGWQFAAHVVDACESCWTKSAAMDRGPPYTRLTNLPTKSVWENPQRIGVDSDKQMGILVSQPARPVYYAMGLLNFEGDLERLDLADSSWPPPGVKMKIAEPWNLEQDYAVNGMLQLAGQVNPKYSEEAFTSMPPLTKDDGEVVAGGKSKEPKSVVKLGNQPVTRSHPQVQLTANESELETEESCISGNETECESLASRSDKSQNSASLVSRILQQNKARVVRQIVTYCRQIIGSRTSQTQEVRDEGGGAGGQSSSSKPGTANLGSGRPESGKRRLSNLKDQGDPDQGGRRGEGDDKKRPTKRARVLAEETATESLKLACPYFKRNPVGPRIGQSCGGPGWNTIHRLKEHLYRRHACVRCLRCGSSFRSENDLVPHSRAATACIVSCTTIDPDDGFEKHQETLLRRRWKAAITTEEQWRQVYKILFPDDSEDLMPSPYYQDHRTMVDEFARFETFLRRETTRLLEERLNESLLDGNARADPASLVGQLANVVNEIQSEAIRSYRDASGPQLEAAGGPHDQSGGEVEGSNDSPDHATSLSSSYVSISELLAGATYQQGFQGVTAGDSGEFDLSNLDDLDGWYDLFLPIDSNFGGQDGEQKSVGQSDSDDWANAG